MALKSKFNQGKFTSTGIDEQYNDLFWSKGAIREAMRKKTFSQMGDRLTQPKHYGDEIVKERRIPVLHPLNQLDGNIDATKAALMDGTFYAYDANGALLGSFESRDYAINAGDGKMPGSFNAQAAAAAMATGTGTVRSGAGSLYNGDADYAVISASYPTLAEEGGNVNEVNTRSITTRGFVNEFGIHMKFTQRSIDMDSRTGVLAQKTKDLGEAKGDIFEAQIQTDLLDASALNRTYAGTTATSMLTLDEAGALRFEDLRLMEQELKRLLVPRDTKIIIGSTKISTVTVQKAFYAFVGQELYPTLQDMTWNGVNVWGPIDKYKDAAGSNYAEGEIGRIGGFRFVEVANMQKYKGVGADATAGTGTFHTSTAPDTGGGVGVESYDAFPVLFVGSDSFATVSFEGDSSKIKTAMPKADAHNDPFGKNGSMSISWYYGSLIYKPERIRQIACTAKIV